MARTMKRPTIRRPAGDEPRLGENLDARFSHAMGSTALRLQIAKEIAERRGLTTRDAIAFAEGPLKREIGVGATVQQALAHLENPYLDTPAGVS